MVNKSFLPLLPLAFSLLSSLGCSASDASGGGDPGTVGMSAAEFGQRYCALLSPCCTEVGVQSDMKACRALFGTVPPKDGDAAEACLVAYEERAGQANWCQNFASESQPAACAVAFPSSTSPEPIGTKSIGQACDTTDDCAPSDRGDVSCTTVGNDKVCQLRARVLEGEPCAASTDDGATYFSGEIDAIEIAVCARQDGVYCEEGTCHKIGSLGGACTSSLGCVDGTYCAEDVCSAQMGAGASCAQSSNACDDASYCDFDSQTCLDKRPAGASCSDWGECETGYCSVDETCEEFGVGAGQLSLAMLCM
jgi:hypothetical protein